MTPHKAGFVNILGKPNVGKSTLMNALLGNKLSITSPKAQTTRHRIKGIINGDDYQIVFSDTPGILKPSYLLHEKMMGIVHTAVDDADMVLFMIDATFPEFDDDILRRLEQSHSPVYLLINKIDQINQEVLESMVESFKTKHAWKGILPISASNNFNTDVLLRTILDELPESPPFFPKDQLTDLPERFFVAEIVREKIFYLYKQEIPYSVEVHVDNFKDTETLVRISVIIYVSRESQKPIVIGKGGEMLKKVGTQARKDMEAFLGKKVFLELFVKVRDDWRDKPNHLRNFGYDNF